MATLRTRKDRVHGGGQRSSRWRCERETHVNPLIAHEPHACSSMLSSTPVTPAERGWTNCKRVQQDADLARLCGGAAIPLTLLTERTGAATKDASSVHHTQAAVGFSALLMRDQLLVCWALKRSIGLEGKILAREATGLPCGTHFWGGIARGRSCIRWRGEECWRKLGRANWIRMKLMPQFEPQLPGPLGDQLPALLSPGRMAAPSVWVLLSIFV